MLDSTEAYPLFVLPHWAPKLAGSFSAAGGAFMCEKCHAGYAAPVWASTQCEPCSAGTHSSTRGASETSHQGGHATARFLEGFLEGSLTAGAS